MICLASFIEAEKQISLETVSYSEDSIIVKDNNIPAIC